MEVDEGSDQKSDIKPNRMSAHARLKNEFTEDEKYHNLLRWLILCISKIQPDNFRQTDRGLASGHI